MTRLRTRGLGLVIALALVATGCTDATTSVRLEITAAPTLALDGLVVTVDGTRHEAAMTESLLLVVPERWAGLARRIEVEGTRLQASVAAGAVVVVPIAGQEVIARITLVDASCELVCNVGDASCEGDAAVACELGADGCPRWSEPAACPMATPFCSSGACSDTCTDDCAQGDSVCQSSTSERTCGQFDSDACLDWSPAVECGSSEVCADDRCMAGIDLTVVTTGTGAGMITSSPSGIACGTTCSASYAAGTMVTLTATPDAGTTFTGWTGGGCSGVGTCVVTLAAATQVTAAFARSIVGTVSSGETHACWLKHGGVVVCWGNNYYGQTAVPTGTFTDVSAGGFFTCAIRTDGTVACWGKNDQGTTAAPAGTFIEVNADFSHACAIRTDGTVACWGSNNFGESTPPSGTFTHVAAGQWFTCGIRTNGMVSCWGKNDDNQATPPTGTFEKMSAGFFHSCGIRTGGSVACWGYNGSGQASPPTGTFTDVSAATGYHSCAIQPNGTVACWGSNARGEATPPSGTFIRVSAGTFFTCGLTTNGSVVCWGSNDEGQLTPP